MKKIVTVLSIDGGGIRGIIPAMVLSQIEKKTGKKISELFDLITGTSTGGILTLGLTVPNENLSPKYSAEDLIELYEIAGPKIFKKSAWRSFRTLWGLLNEKYDAKNIEEVLYEYFGESKLKDVLTNVLITGYEIERRISWFFKSVRASKDENYNYFMRDIARSTSAAPTYFAPSHIKSLEQEERYTLVDGGVFANNPAMCGYTEAITMFPEAESILIISLGTGEQTERISYQKAKNWGLASWAQPILGVVFDGVSDTIDYQLKKIIKPNGKIPMYFRFQLTLSGVNEDLDDASPENIRNLKLLAEDLIRDRQNELDLVCEELLLFSQNKYL